MKVESSLGSITFPTQKTVVAQKVWYKEDEDIVKVAETILHKALELPEIKVVRAERKSGWKTGTGLVKIELENNDCVRTVIKNKRKLKDAPV